MVEGIRNSYQYTLLTNEESGVIVNVHIGTCYDRKGNTQMRKDNTPNP